MAFVLKRLDMCKKLNFLKRSDKGTDRFKRFKIYDSLKLSVESFAQIICARIHVNRNGSFQPKFAQTGTIYQFADSRYSKISLKLNLVPYTMTELPD